MRSEKEKEIAEIFMEKARDRTRERKERQRRREKTSNGNKDEIRYDAPAVASKLRLRPLSGHEKGVRPRRHNHQSHTCPRE